MSKKPCLHCLIGHVLKDFIEKYPEIDGDFIVEAMADVLGDVMGGSESTPDDWMEALTLFNLSALRRAQHSRDVRNERDARDNERG